MRNLSICFVVTILFDLPLSAQVQTGSLVVYQISQRADYVVIGAESRNITSTGGSDDRSCKVISLGGDTLFFSTGNVVIGVHRGNSWDSKATARAVYRSSSKRDANSLSLAWANKAMKWFYAQSAEDLGKSAHGAHGNLVTGGFINFDKQETLHVHAADISFDASKRQLRFDPVTQVPGQVGITGVAADLVEEFTAGKTDRSAKAYGPIGSLRQFGVAPMVDVQNIRHAIKFAMDNAVGADKVALGGDIDMAILYKNGTIEWPYRKSWCSQLDQEPTHPTRPTKAK